MADGLECYGLHGDTCTTPSPFDAVIVVQFAAGVGILALVYLLAVELTGQWLIGAMTIIMYVLLGRIGEYARYIQPENVKHLLLFAGLYIATIGYRTNSIALFACAGAFLGAAALFHPYYVYLLVLVPGVMTLMFRPKGADRPTDQSFVAAQLAFAILGILVVLPWLVRNVVLFGDPMLTDIYEARDLAERIAYNDMPVSEWLIAVVHWIPTNGDDIARALFGETARVQLNASDPHSYAAAARKIFAAAMSSAPEQNPVSYLLTEKLSPGSHLAVTPIMITRGMWGSHGFMAYVGLALLPFLAWHLLASPKREAALALFVTAVLLLLVHALLTANYYRLNVPMLFLTSLAVSHALATLRAHRPWLGGALIGGGLALWGVLLLLKIYRHEMW